jgi:hypothetical protein
LINDRPLISDPGTLDDVIEEEEKNRGKNSRTISTSTLKYLKDLQQKHVTKCPIFIDPDAEVEQFEFGKEPSIDIFYRKKVICVAPHLNFSMLQRNIKCSTCKQRLYSKRWGASIRTVHDLGGTCNVMLYSYYCNNNGCSEKKKEVHAFSTFADGTYKMELDPGTRSLYGISLTSKSGVTADLMQYIVDDTMTSK